MILKSTEENASPRISDHIYEFIYHINNALLAHV